LTQAELADKAGVHHHSLTKLEHGDRDPSWFTVLALAEALGCEPNDFLPDDSDEAGESAPRRPGRPKRSEDDESEKSRRKRPKKG
jgi:transcriptional regulator with XRE-family HTH domain